MEDQTWYDDLLDAAKEQLGGIQASGEVAGLDVTLGRLPGPSWPLVSGVLLVVLVLIILAGR